MKINELLCKEEYEKVVKFLMSNDYRNVSELSANFISSIEFIPGVDFGTLKQAKEKLLKTVENYILVNANINKNNNNIDKRKTEDYKERIEINKFLDNIPRAHYFTSYCYKKGILYLDQIDESILTEISSIRNIGKHTAELISQQLNSYFGIEVGKKIEYKFINSNNTEDNSSIYGLYSDKSKGSYFINYCHSLGLHKINDLIGYNFDSITINGISKNMIFKFKEILLYHLRFNNYIFNAPEIHQTMLNQKISLFISQEKLSILGYKDEFTVEDFVKNLSSYDYTFLASELSSLKLSVIEYFEVIVSTLRNRDYEFLVYRSQGKSLQEIANEYNITRERVRQVVLKSVNYLYPYIMPLMNYLTKANKKVVYLEELKLVEFSNSNYYKIVKYILNNYKDSNYMIFNFSNKIILKEKVPLDYDEKMLKIFISIIGEGISYQCFLEQAMENLNDEGFQFIEAEDIEIYLLDKGYYFFENFIMPKNSSYALACINAIEDNFDYDIKLDDAEDNEDMKRLRIIMKKDYPGLSIGTTNRALSSRLMDYMILSGRGRYLPVSKLCFDKDLISLIVDYINSSSQNTFYFSEIYEIFKKDLILARIHNRYLLQGILKYYYAEYFNFDRDSISKINVEKESFDSRVKKLILLNKAPLTRLEIINSIPGLNESILVFIIDRNKDLINFGNNVVNHINNLNLSNDLLNKMAEFIENEILLNEYLSVYVLFKYLNNKFKSELQKNEINDARSLYYVAQVYFSDKYDMKESPHIINKGILTEINSYEIVKYFLLKEGYVSKSKVEKFAERHEWASVTFYYVMQNIDENYFRINEFEYLDLDLIRLPSVFVEELDRTIDKLIGDLFFIPTAIIHDFNKFPEVEYEWNGFLLESFIKLFSLNFSILYPKAKDRRYIKSIITRKNPLISSFEDAIVISLLDKNINRISEYDLIDHLNNEGFPVDQVPHEFYKGDRIYYKNDYFIII